MAYSPVEQRRILRDRTLGNVASHHGATPAQVALACSCGKGRLAHMRENRAALDLTLTQTDLAELARAFPPPRGAHPLEML